MSLAVGMIFLAFIFLHLRMRPPRVPGHSGHGDGRSACRESNQSAGIKAAQEAGCKQRRVSHRILLRLSAAGGSRGCQLLVTLTKIERTDAEEPRHDSLLILDSFPRCGPLHRGKSEFHPDRPANDGSHFVRGGWLAGAAEPSRRAKKLDKRGDFTAPRRMFRDGAGHEKTEEESHCWRLVSGVTGCLRRS